MTGEFGLVDPDLDLYCSNLALLQRRLRCTHRHKRSGRLYSILRRGTWEPTKENVVIYEATNGRVWVRNEAEFEDGRFVSAPRSTHRWRYRKVKAWNINKRLDQSAMFTHVEWYF